MVWRVSDLTTDQYVGLLSRIAKARGLGVPADELEAIGQFAVVRLRPVREMNAIEFPFMDPVEPLHALRWIQRGGS